MIRRSQACEDLREKHSMQYKRPEQKRRKSNKAND